MKILFTFFCKEFPHYETELELLERHFLQGDNLYILNCTGGFDVCKYGEWRTKPSECFFCQKKIKKVLSIHNNAKIISFNNIDYTHMEEIPNFDNIEILKSYNYEKHPAGMSVASCMISKFENEFFRTDKNATFIKDSLKSSIQFYVIFDRILNKYKFDLIYIVNGRRLMQFAMISACNKNKVHYITHEVTNAPQKYYLFDNTLPQDNKIIPKLVNDYCNAVGYDCCLKQAKTFCQNKMLGISKVDKNYIQNQNSTELPKDYDNNKKNIVFFDSSPFEYAALPFSYDFFPDAMSEWDFISFLAKSLESDNIHIYLRMHPNMANYYDRYIKDVNRLNSTFPNLTIISPQSSVSSYCLLKQSDVVMTTNSTIGAEAAFWGKPLIVIGNAARYFYLNFFYKGTKENIVKLLKSELQPKSNRDAILFLAYNFYGGLDYHYVKLDRDGSTLNGIPLYDWPVFLKKSIRKYIHFFVKLLTD